MFSKRSIPAAGTVIFTVVNTGKISHNFFIAGKVTPNLLPGQVREDHRQVQEEGSLRVSVHDPRTRGSRMKGIFSVGLPPVKPPPSTPSTTPTTTARTTSTVPVGTAQTTVTVNMVEYAFQLSQSTIPSGQVTFVINNKGNEVHNFAIVGNKAGAQIAPGTSETWTVALPPGTYNYHCDVPFHAERGMVGQFTVAS